MRIAINHNSIGMFSEYWIAYCRENNIEYKIVDCRSSDIIEQLRDCDALMWHHSHTSISEILFAKQLLFSLQQSGKKVFPDFNTMWHFDDKVGQKYLFEATGAPCVPSYVFYDKQTALQWAQSTSFPKVWKLRGGAGSSNVKLAKTRKDGVKFINRAFGKGFSQYNSIDNLKERIRKYRLGKTTLFDVLKGVVRIFHTTKFAEVAGRERGYAYFQDYMPANEFDIRVIVINGKAFAIKRMCRKNDFRASGSGNILFEKKEFDERCIKISFETTCKIKSQCAAFDFVFDKDNNPLLVEVSYGFVPSVYTNCVGYWDCEMKWHEGKFNPYGWMVESVVSSIKSEK